MVCGAGYWVLNVPGVCEQIVGHKGGGYKEIRLELFIALAGLKIPKICLTDMWSPVYRRVVAGDKGWRECLILI